MPFKSKPADSEHLSEERIRERAYLLWEADGRPEGRGDHYWYLAHAEARRFVVERTADAVARVTKNPNDPPASVRAGMPGADTGQASPRGKAKPVEAKRNGSKPVNDKPATRKAAPRPPRASTRTRGAAEKAV